MVLINILIYRLFVVQYSKGKVEIILLPDRDNFKECISSSAFLITSYEVHDLKYADLCMNTRTE